MGKMEDLNAKADSLQATVDDVQAKVQASSDGLAQQITDLKAALDAAGAASDPAIQAVIDKLDATQQDLAATAQAQPPPAPPAV